jgi:hypothetical protein
MMKVGKNVIQVFNDNITIELECILMFYKDHNVTIVHVKSFVPIITLDFWNDLTCLCVFLNVFNLLMVHSQQWRYLMSVSMWMW